MTDYHDLHFWSKGTTTYLELFTHDDALGKTKSKFQI